MNKDLTLRECESKSSLASVEEIQAPPLDLFDGKAQEISKKRGKMFR